VLAGEAGLSLSRVSRIVDALEARRLVERQPCPGDARAINAQLTPPGLELAQAAQTTHLAAVRERFFDRLSAREIEMLAEIFPRFSPEAPSACSAG
jgi:DNA-binding MarR family transcriptional regulator